MIKAIPSIYGFGPLECDMVISVDVSYLSSRNRERAKMDHRQRHAKGLPAIEATHFQKAVEETHLIDSARVRKEVEVARLNENEIRSKNIMDRDLIGADQLEQAILG